MSFLSLQGIAKRYGSLTALDGIDLDVAQGSRIAVVGASGSGKTTLLRLIAGFEAPDAGTITLDGEPLADGTSIVPTHRRSIGVVMQDGALFPHLSVADNISFGLDRGHSARDARIDQLMATVELDQSMRERRPHELSGGQQQRVALARAIARQPKLMLLDEPFSALDTGLRETLRKAVADILRAAGITTMLVTHDQAEALSFADQVAVLRAGRLVQVGTPRTLYFQPCDPQTALFIGNAIVLSAEIEAGSIRCAFGRLPVETGGRQGSVQIMLRPEQIRLVPVDKDVAIHDADRTAAYGEIIGSGFGGADCVTTIRVIERIAGAGWTTPLEIRGSSLESFPIGTFVRIAVAGAVHVFSADAVGV